MSYLILQFSTVVIGGKWENKRPTLTMTGGSISHNEAFGNESNGNGGGVYINDESTNMTLSDRSRISQNNSRGKGGGIYVNGALSVSGAPQVSGNEIVLSETESGKTNTVLSNIYLPSGKTISASDIGGYVGETGYITPSLYFTAENGTADITDSCEDFSDYFFSDNIDYAVAYKDGVIKLLTGHKVTFVYDAEKTEVYAVADGYKVKEPDGEPWRIGFAFIGWQIDGNDYDFSTPVTKDITLTPKWISTDKPTVSLSRSKVYASGLSGKAKVHLAAYNENGVLIASRIETVEFDCSKSFAELGFNTDSASEITAFLWSKKMQPLCDKAFIKLKTE